MQRIKVGDTVAVIAGKEKGKSGTVTRILRKEGRVIIEGLNLVTKHQKPNAQSPEGGKVTKEAPIHLSNVMPIDPETQKPTRVKIRVGEDGKKTRVAKSGASLDAG